MAATIARPRSRVAPLVGMVIALTSPFVLRYIPGGGPYGITNPVNDLRVLLLRIAMFVTAGFCEELTLRAYAIERLALFTGNLPIAGIVTAAVFTLAHAPRYGFTPLLLGVAVFAIALTALYLKTRNLFACAIVHALIDSVGLVIRPALGAHASVHVAP